MRISKSFRSAAFLAAATTILISSGAQASVVLSDQILLGGSPNYTADTNLFPQNPTSGTGWSGGWTGNNASSIKVKTENLSMPGLENGGGSIGITAISANETRKDNRSFTPAVGQGTLWFSSLFRPDIIQPDSQTMIGFQSDAIASGAPWVDASLQGFAWGTMNGNNLTVQYQTNAANSATAGALSTSASAMSLTAGVTYLLVGKLDINSSGADTLSIWITTSVPGSEVLLGAANISINSDILNTSADLDVVNLWLSRGATGNSNAATMDALRIGTTFADIAPVPEPKTLALFAAGGLVFLAARLRRKENCS